MVSRRSISWVGVLAWAIPAWYLVLGVALSHRATKIPYFVTSYMVSYSGGFVRRGLLGQVVLWLTKALHVPAWNVIEGLRLVLAVAFLACLGYGIYRNAGKLGMAGGIAVLASPLVSALGYAEFGAVDLIFILIAVVNATLARRLDVAEYLKWSILLFSTLGVCVCLTHEGFLLLGIPINLIISARKLGWRSWRRLLVVYAAPVVACLVCIWFRGTAFQAHAIREAWLSHGIPIPADSVLAYFYVDLAFQINGVLSAIHLTGIILFLTIAAFCFAPLYLLVKGGARGAEWKALLRDFFWVPFLFTLPLYLIGFDWDRWVLITVGTGVLCLLHGDIFTREFKPGARKSVNWALVVLAAALIYPVSPNNPYRLGLNGPLSASIRLILKR